MVVGSSGGLDDKGKVNVYEWNGSQWEQVGFDIYGKEEGDLFGTAVAINGEGDRIAAGSVSLSNEEYVDGYVKAFSLDGGFVQVDLSLDEFGTIDSIVATNGIII